MCVYIILCCILCSCLLFISAGLSVHKTRVKTLELNVVFARFLRRSSKRRCWVSAAQNSFLPVAGATGSHYLTWMMLKQFGLGGERWFSKKKVLEPAPQSGEVFSIQFAAGFFLHAHRRTHPQDKPPQRSRIVGHAAVGVSCSSAGCRLAVGGFFLLCHFSFGVVR